MRFGRFVILQTSFLTRPTSKPYPLSKDEEQSEGLNMSGEEESEEQTGVGFADVK